MFGFFSKVRDKSRKVFGPHPKGAKTAHKVMEFAHVGAAGAIWYDHHFYAVFITVVGIAIVVDYVFGGTE